MEICMMDTNPSASHFYQQGIGSNQMYKNANYETIGGEQSYANHDKIINQFQSPEAQMPGSSQSIPFREPQISHQPTIQYPCEADNQQQIRPWKVEVECKQEIDHSTNHGGADVCGESYSTNFGSYGSESSYYGYRGDRNNSCADPQVIYNRENEGSTSGDYNPYQLPASSKNQIPSWYQPPSQLPPQHHYNPHQQQNPATFYPPNCYPHPYQANYIGAPSASLTTEHNMRNMIQMTVNRYAFYFFIA